MSLFGEETDAVLDRINKTGRLDRAGLPEGMEAFDDLLGSIARIREAMPIAAEQIGVLRDELGAMSEAFDLVRRVVPDLFALADLIPQMFEVAAALGGIADRFTVRAEPVNAEPSGRDLC